MSWWRSQVLLWSFFSLALLVIWRLAFWQIISGEKLQAEAESQHFVSQEIPAPRGKIFTADGFPLVSNQKAFLVWAFLPQVTLEPGKVAESLATVSAFKDTRQDLGKKLTREDLKWVALARKVDLEVKKEVEKLAITGVGFEEEEKRFYPEGSLSAHLLGFVGQDSSGRDKGYFGLEGFYDRQLKGRPGFLRQEKDASGRPILIGQKDIWEEIPGKDLYLHLNRSVQFLVEEKLKEGLNKYGAKAGSVVVLDPQTGGVLAMASFPSYDPLNYALQDKTYFPNPVIAQTFEPGSILKVLVMAAALEEKVVSLQDHCPCLGPKVIGEYTIKTWNNQYFPNSTPTDIIVHSDNVGMVWVGEKLGTQRLGLFLARFGLNELTGIDLEEEVTSLLRPAKVWSPIDLATISFGQGLAITPLEMVRAVAAIANGGKLLQPQVALKIKSLGKEISLSPKVAREVISPITAKIVKEMMVKAVEEGEAKWARPKGYRIAGKTGTAQIPIAGHYDEEKTIASFVGFAPADNPRFVMLVTLREPTSSPWGSETAAPLWFEIAKEIFSLWGIQPE